MNYSFSTNRERFNIIFRLVNKQHFSLSDNESRNQSALSCRIDVNEDNATIPTLYAAKYRCIAITGDIQLVIKNIGHGPSAEQILSAVMPENGSITSLKNKINVVCKSLRNQHYHWISPQTSAWVH